MQVVPVIDLMNGVVVRGIAGRREEYRPIVSQIARDALPQTVARALVEKFSLATVYVADLDAIAGKAANGDAWQQIADAGLRLWLDAGTGNVFAARSLCARLAEKGIDADVVIGMESLDRAESLDELLAELSPERLIFSLDLKGGLPLTRVAAWRDCFPDKIAREVIARGVKRLILLDLADVGTSRGTGTLDLCLSLRESFPELELITGGGVRGVTDLTRINAAGASAVLVASALHDGHLSRDDLTSFVRPSK